MDSSIKVSGDNIYLNMDNGKGVSDVKAVDIEDFIGRIDTKDVSIGVIGLGYSGLQLAVAFASAGFKVTGIEFNRDRARQINKGHSYVENISSEKVKKLVQEDKLFVVYDFDVLSELDVIIISDQIPSQFPINKDVSFIMAVIEKIIDAMEKTQLIIIDTVTLPGTCGEVIFPVFAEQKKEINKDFFLALSPERIEPGNLNVKFSLIPRIVSGLTSESRVLASKLFHTITKQVIEVSSPKVAETAKLLENAYRWVNTALVNEMMMMCNKLGISIWEVIRAVRTNPFEHFHFVPGPGYGTTSRYNDEAFSLSWKKVMDELKYDILDKAIEINTYTTTRYVIERISDLLNSRKKCLNGSNILLVGVSSKRDISDWNESSALEIIKMLLDKKVNVYYHDPLVKTVKLEKMGVALSSVNLDEDMLKWVDSVVILMDHKKIDFEKIVKHASLILDTRNVTGKLKGDKSNINVL